MIAMRIPAIHGLIDRRILVNYHLEPEVVARHLPSPFRPKTLRGRAIGGICLIRLRDIRPKFLPLPCGIGSENAAHRIAVQWEIEGQQKEGVFIPRRDTDSRLNALSGGRLFPGEHNHARFQIHETPDHLSVKLDSDDGHTHVSVVAKPGSKLPSSSIFESLPEASEFFEAGSLGYSVTADPTRFDGVELRCRTWRVEPLEVEHVASSFFDNPAVFPAGSAIFDCALLMRGIEHEWVGREDLCCTQIESDSAEAANAQVLLRRIIPSCQRN
jgi:hypothetical protein